MQGIGCCGPPAAIHLSPLPPTSAAMRGRSSSACACLLARGCPNLKPICGLLSPAAAGLSHRQASRRQQRQRSPCCHLPPRPALRPCLPMAGRAWPQHGGSKRASRQRLGTQSRLATCQSRGSPTLGCSCSCCLVPFLHPPSRRPHSLGGRARCGPRRPCRLQHSRSRPRSRHRREHSRRSCRSRRSTRHAGSNRTPSQTASFAGCWCVAGCVLDAAPWALPVPRCAL